MKKWRLILFALLFPLSGFGFTFTVTPTAETCTGNGTLSFATSNANPGGSIVYEVYALPNLIVPIATVTGTSLNGLSGGDYKIIAKETVNGMVTTVEQNVTIVSTVVALTYLPQGINQACSSNSNIVVNVLTGTASSYEIFSGPVLFPPQSSNIFAGVPVGVYKIRVFDSCGNGVVSTYTVNLNPTGLTIGSPSFSNTLPPSCSTTIVTHVITPATGTVIGYPLQIQYVVHPPGGGAAQTFNTTLNSGDPASQSISQTIPDFPNQSFDYDVNITDSCGTPFTDNFIVNQQISVQPVVFDLDCNSYYFELKASNFTPPYNLNFTSFPAGFNPGTYNANYPGPFSNENTIFGGAGQLTPVGSYDVTITDSCGRTKTVSFVIVNEPVNAAVTATNNGCASHSGKIEISIFGYRITTATITAAPVDYPFALPQDVSASINPATGKLLLDPLPLGDYTIEVINNCNTTLAPLNVSIPTYTDIGLASETRPGCTLNRSSIKVSSKNTALSTISITAAPPGFAESMPYDSTNNIAADGNFYRNDLPAGDYTFTATDQCNFTNTITVTVAGYAITSSNFSLVENCGSFDIPLDFDSNATTNQSFWLQKLIDPQSNTWGHPATGLPYTDGTVPNNGNSYPLVNEATNFNLNFNGTFRIVRSFSTYNNGAEFNAGTVLSLDKDCIEVLSPTLFFDQVLEITDAYRMPCSTSGNLDVVVEANGTAPIHYTIIEKDGLPFSFDNFNSNVFSNLPSGIYRFKIEDNCGNIVTRLFDVNNLLSLVTITDPNDLTECRDVVTGNETFDLTAQTPIILGSQLPANYTLTYHQSIADVQNNVNPIQNLAAYDPDTNPKTIFARLSYNPLPNCYESVAFDLFIGQNPTLAVNTDYLSCSSNPVSLDVSHGNLPTTTYLWSDGSTSPTITVTQIGTTNLTVTATNTYPGSNLNCTNTKNIEVIISEAPEIDRIDIEDWTYDENSITIFTTNSGAFEYSLDGVTYQDESTFSNLKAGVYTVYVRDKFKCSVVQQEIWILNYPNFFTPNGDGYNDTWFIENGDQEPKLNVTIMDRYGKILKYLDDKNKSWDGSYNGHQAVSTDYWFIVIRQDGRTHRGHFSLKR